MKQALRVFEAYPGSDIALRRAGGVCLLLFLSIMGVALFPACGKKGPPFLPEKTMDVRVDRPTGTWADGKIRLEGSLSGGDNHGEITGCTVSYAWYPGDQTPCEGCPIPMKERFENAEMEISGDQFRCVVPVAEKRGIWFTEIRLIDSNGAVGPPSERIRIHAQN